MHVKHSGRVLIDCYLTEVTIPCIYATFMVHGCTQDPGVCL